MSRRKAILLQPLYTWDTQSLRSQENFPGALSMRRKKLRGTHLQA